MSIPALRERAAAEGLPLAIVAAEALHVILLDALFGQPGSEIMAFQGGTCVHLVHGGYRYSEDLDLAGRDLDAAAAQALIARAAPMAEKLSVQVLGAGEWVWKAPTRAGRVSTHWFHFTPQETGRRIRVKIELARFPTYEAAALPVRSELDLLRRRPLVNALQPEELLAEKVTALLGRRYLKGRDIFDLWYLGEVLRAPIRPDLLQRKLDDYGVGADAEQARERIAAATAADLQAEMDRFLPARHRDQLGREGYGAVRSAARSVLERAAREVGLW